MWSVASQDAGLLAALGVTYNVSCHHVTNLEYNNVNYDQQLLSVTLECTLKGFVACPVLSWPSESSCESALRLTCTWMKVRNFHRPMITWSATFPYQISRHREIIWLLNWLLSSWPCSYQHCMQFRAAAVQTQVRLTRLGTQVLVHFLGTSCESYALENLPTDQGAANMRENSQCHLFVILYWFLLIDLSRFLLFLNLNSFHEDFTLTRHH